MNYEAEFAPKCFYGTSYLDSLNNGKKGGSGKKLKKSYSEFLWYVEQAVFIGVVFCT